MIHLHVDNDKNYQWRVICHWKKAIFWGKNGFLVNIVIIDHDGHAKLLYVHDETYVQVHKMYSINMQLMQKYMRIR